LVEVEKIGHPVELAGGHAENGIVEKLFFHSSQNLVRDCEIQKRISRFRLFGMEMGEFFRVLIRRMRDEK
jgi:hypothetical protein